MTFDPYKSPALAYLMEQAFLASRAGVQVTLMAGMGVPGTMFTLDEIEQVYDLIQVARHRTVKTWRGLDVRHTVQHVDTAIDYSQFDIFAALDAGTRYITQEAFDFLTLRDQKGAKLECFINANKYSKVAPLQSLFGDPAQIKLSLAFRSEMVQQAEPYRAQIATGAYVLKREPFPALDEHIAYESLRLWITPAGIAASIVYENNYVPFWWSPELDTNTSQVWVPADVRFAFDVLMACIWRDACIVKTMFVRQQRKAYQASGKSLTHDSNVVRLPRTIYESEWGDKDERAHLSHITHRAHTVRGHYRELADGHSSSEEAHDAALEYGYPEPPEGFTFVRPHIRGDGDLLPSVRKVVCEGLRVAKTVLG